MLGLAALTPSLASGNARTTVGSGAAAAAVATPLVTTLSGRAEIPGPGDPDGTGAAAVTIDRATGEICADLRVSNIATATAAHIHRGLPTESGPVVVDFGAFLPRPASAGCVMAAPALATEIATNPNGFYVNVHNAEFPAGAVRGNLAVTASTTGMTRILDTPLRAYDSRDTGAPMTPGETRVIDLATASNGLPGGGGILAVPPGATGAVVRIAVTNTGGPGFLKSYSAALTTQPPTAALNWYEPNAIIGAESVVAVDTFGRIKLSAGPENTGTAHVVVDVVGFVY
jgi:hypothetical protein